VGLNLGSWTWRKRDFVQTRWRRGLRPKDAKKARAGQGKGGGSAKRRAGDSDHSSDVLIEDRPKDAKKACAGRREGGGPAKRRAADSDDSSDVVMEPQRTRVGKEPSVSARRSAEGTKARAKREMENFEQWGRWRSNFEQWGRWRPSTVGVWQSFTQYGKSRPRVLKNMAVCLECIKEGVYKQLSQGIKNASLMKNAHPPRIITGP